MKQAQLEHFTKAAQLDASNPAAWTAVFQAARVSQDPIRKIQAREALKRAYALRPDNLYLLLELLLQQAELKDVQIAETLAHARELMTPLAEAIKRLNNFDVLQALNTASTALNEQPADYWGKVLLQVRYVNNVVRKETATQRDQRRVLPHELEYVIKDFSPEFYESAYLPAAINALFHSRRV